VAAFAGLVAVAAALLAVAARALGRFFAAVADFAARLRVLLLSSATGTPSPGYA
jgi:hypothetical protein